MTAEGLRGVCHIMITPFTPDERVDTASLRRVAAAAVDAGAAGLVPLGIMGEAHKLLDRERDEVLAAVVAEARGRVPVIAGCSGESTVVTVERVQAAQQQGADAVMVAPPRNVKAPELLLAHYEAVAKAAEVPVVIQDEPVTTGVELPVALIGQLLDVVQAGASGVGLVKVEETPSPAKITRVLGQRPHAACFGGLGGVFFLEELGRGAVGTMTGFALPELLVRIYRHWAAGETDAAREVFYRHLPLIRFEAQLGVGGVAIRKQLFAQRGIIASPTVRGPAAGVDQQTLTELLDLLSHLDLR
jgi:4-hydroxy-tetrahydrodipicolinate synthase